MSLMEQLRAEHLARRQRLGMISPPMKREPPPPVPEKVAEVEKITPREKLIKAFGGPRQDTEQYGCALEMMMGHGAATPAPPTLRSILAKVSAAHNIDPQTIKSQIRVAWVTRARMEFYYLAARDTVANYVEIGRFCGGRDHTTILSGIGVYCRKHSLPHPRDDESLYAERKAARRIKYKKDMEELRAKNQELYRKRLSQMMAQKVSEVIRDDKGRFVMVQP